MEIAADINSVVHRVLDLIQMSQNITGPLFIRRIRDSVFRDIYGNTVLADLLQHGVKSGRINLVAHFSGLRAFR